MDDASRVGGHVTLPGPSHAISAAASLSSRAFGPHSESDTFDLLMGTATTTAPQWYLAIETGVPYPADPHDLDGVADHVGGALLAFRSS